jgi:hypothetical protein
MSTDATKVRVAVTGALYYAVAGTTLPTDTTTSLNVAFKDVGYLLDTGTIRQHQTSSKDIIAWQNADIPRVVITQDTVDYKFVMIESNSTSRQIYYGNIDGSLTTKGVGGAGTSGCWVLHVIDGTLLTRIVVPNGQITAWDDVTFAGGDSVNFGVTLTCYPDGSGNKDYTYVNG